MDPVALEIANQRFAAIAEEMGVVLGRTALSPNIKERRDYSCALFDARGGLVAQAAHIPVHLGSTPLSVRAALSAVAMGPGDVVILNDPFAGGTHLPDVTVVAPVFLPGARRALGYVANRAHHADIGGMTPGSMPLASEIFQEGFRLPPVRLVAAGRVVDEVRALFLANTRVSAERDGDLMAQWAALRVGADRLRELARTRGAPQLRREMTGLQEYSRALMQATLARLPPGTYRATDVLDDDGLGSGPLRIRVAITVRGGRARVDFTGTAQQTRGPLNANLAITRSCVLYVFSTLAEEDIPPNEGLAQPLAIIVPEGTLLNARFPAAVAGGNVETSQRIVDVCLRALARALPGRIPAASAGTMNNLALGGLGAQEFAYYETLAGGAGGGPQGPGASAVHTHMTNTMNTPIEALEAYYPLRVHRYGVRRGSGGRGAHPGGDGLVRELEFLVPARVTLLGERRRVAPWGLAGGGPGARGRDWLIRGGRARPIPSKTNLDVAAGDRLRLETPGGGGYGRARRRRRIRRP